MRKILTLLLLLLTFSVSAQFTKPTGAVAIPTYSFFRIPGDSTTVIYQGSVNLYNPLLSKSDSTKVKGYVTNYSMIGYEVTVTVDGVTSYTMPFALRSRANVFYNGQLLKKSLWYGVGTTYLSVSVDTRVNDYIKIQN